VAWGKKKLRKPVAKEKKLGLVTSKGVKKNDFSTPLQICRPEKKRDLCMRTGKGKDGPSGMGRGEKSGQRKKKSAGVRKVAERKKKGGRELLAKKEKTPVCAATRKTLRPGNAGGKRKKTGEVRRFEGNKERFI